MENQASGIHRPVPKLKKRSKTSITTAEVLPKACTGACGAFPISHSPEARWLILQATEGLRTQLIDVLFDNGALWAYPSPPLRDLLHASYLGTNVQNPNSLEEVAVLLRKAASLQDLVSMSSPSLNIALVMSGGSDIGLSPPFALTRFLSYLY